MNEPKILIVDAFCNGPFTGNPAAVCFLDQPRSAEWMQAVAAEMNLSETAFVFTQPHPYNLRWFTPIVEVDLCGHATLASAWAMWHLGLTETSQRITFQTRSGTLIARLDDIDTDHVWLDFPAKSTEPVAAPAGLLESLGLPRDVVSFVGRNAFDYLVEVQDESLVRSLSPDFQGLMAIEARGIIVTSIAAKANAGTYDFISRFFAPLAGINEDPVTGSAHCALAPFWSARFRRERMKGFQASRRGGLVEVNCDGDRVHLGGKASVILSGRLLNHA
jgi:PhzF family phenazine biosynthesis protein